MRERLKKSNVIELTETTPTQNVLTGFLAPVPKGSIVFVLFNTDEGDDMNRFVGLWEGGTSMFFLFPFEYRLVG